MITRFFFLCFLVILPTITSAQDFVPLWPKGKVPNSKGLNLADSIANERVYQVGMPGVYVYLPSKEERNGAAVLICPGGGYERLAYNVSGTQLAKWFNTLGVAAFVLNYRLPNSRDLVRREIGPLLDGCRALQLIRERASEWGIDTSRIGVQGMSAGGHLAAMLASGLDGILPDTIRPRRPAFAVLISPVIDLDTLAHKGSRRNLLGAAPDPRLIQSFSAQNRVDSLNPPTFLVLAGNDKAVDPRNSIQFYLALLRNRVSAALHIFPQGAHSIALRNTPGSTTLWPQLCEAWLEEIAIIKP
jgi:acetyl esterase/lipase